MSETSTDEMSQFGELKYFYKQCPSIYSSGYHNQRAITQKHQAALGQYYCKSCDIFMNLKEKHLHLSSNEYQKKKNNLFCEVCAEDSDSNETPNSLQLVTWNVLKFRKSFQRKVRNTNTTKTIFFLLSVFWNRNNTNNFLRKVFLSSLKFI